MEELERVAVYFYFYTRSYPVKLFSVSLSSSITALTFTGFCHSSSFYRHIQYKKIAYKDSRRSDVFSYQNQKRNLMVAFLLILRDRRVATKMLFKHFLRLDRPQLPSASTKKPLSNVRSKISNLKRNWPRNLREQSCNFCDQVVRLGCKLFRANCKSKYQHCGGSLESCAETNTRFDCNGKIVFHP